MNGFQIKCPFSLVRITFVFFALYLGAPLFCFAQQNASEGTTDTAKTGGSDTSNSGSLLFVEKFNTANSDVELINGAKQENIGSGVSGRPGDLAYVNDALDVDKEGTPVALIKKVYPVNGLEEMTITLWYKPSEDQGKVITLLDAGSMQLIGDRPKGWTLRVGAVVDKQAGQYWFPMGASGLYGSWLTAKEWTFAAFTWKLSTNEVCAYQGSQLGGVRAATHVKRPAALGGLEERKDRDKHPDAIGNSSSEKQDHPFRGAIDNVRIYSKALDAVALEKIRQADVKGEEPPKF